MVLNLPLVIDAFHATYFEQLLHSPNQCMLEMRSLPSGFAMTILPNGKMTIDQPLDVHSTAITSTDAAQNGNNKTEKEEQNW